MNYKVKKIKNNLYYITYHELILVQSYDTIVTVLDLKSKTAKILDVFFSRTTSRHINEVLSRCVDYTQERLNQNDFNKLVSEVK
jgi:hypothetical protein